VSPLSVEEVCAEPDAERLTGAAVMQPAGPMRLGESSMPVRGWVLGASARALAVEMRVDDELVRVAPVREPAPDAAAAHPDRPESPHCGFLTRVPLRFVHPHAELRLEAVLADGNRARIAELRFGEAEAPQGRRPVERAAPTIRPDLENLILREAERPGGGPEGAEGGRAPPAVDGARLLAPPGDATGDPRVAALAEVDLRGRAVLDVSGDFGHLARAARARGAALVDVVATPGSPAALAALLNTYHRMTRVSFHADIRGLDRAYDVLIALGEASVPEEAVALAAGLVVTTGDADLGGLRAHFPVRRTLLGDPEVVGWAHRDSELTPP
jgi:hypothetical protein